MLLLVSFPRAEVDMDMTIMHDAFKMLLIFLRYRLVACIAWIRETKNFHSVINLTPLSYQNPLIIVPLIVLVCQQVLHDKLFSLCL